MNYKKLNDFQEHDENPFLEDAIKQVNEHVKNKRIFVKGNRSIMNYIVDDNGETVGQSAFIQNIQVDEDQFVKLYIKGFEAFYELTIPARKVLGYILKSCIIPDRDSFYFDFDEAKKVTGYVGENSIRSGIASLISHGLIARSKSIYKFYLNPLILFNGSRLSFVKTYIKTKKSQGNIENEFHSSKTDIHY